MLYANLQNHTKPRVLVIRPSHMTQPVLKCIQWVSDDAQLMFLLNLQDKDDFHQNQGHKSCLYIYESRDILVFFCYPQFHIMWQLYMMHQFVWQLSLKNQQAQRFTFLGKLKICMGKSEKRLTTPTNKETVGVNEW